MAKSYLTDINLNTNVLLNAKIQAWGTDPTLVGNATKTPDNNGAGPKEGMLSSYAGALYIYKGTSGSGGAWLAVGTGTVTSVTGTSPVSSTGGTTPAISLSSGYGDTQNPYASKTANFVLAAPNGSNGVPTFRALVASDIPSLTGSYQAVDGDLTAISAITGTGWLQRTATDTWSVGTPPNYYPTAVTMTAGTTAGPLVGLTMNTGTVTSTAIPAAAAGASGIITTGAQTIDGVKTFSSFPEVSGTPSTSNQLVNKTYVDTIATGINAHEAVSYASTAEITGTYNNGVSGVGATLTGTGSIVIDGYTVVSGDAGTNVLGGTGMRLLLKNQTTNTDQNGIYAVTACVSGTSWTLTRAYDYDALGEVAAGDFTYVLLGSANAKFTFVETSKPAAISGVGTALNAITFGVFANGNLSGTVNVNQGGTGATTLTGVLKGNGTSAFTAAVAGTDYIAPYGSTTANTFLAAPNGSNGTPTFRTVVYADLPTSSLTGVTTDGIARKKTGLLTANSSTSAFPINHGFGQWVTAQLFDTSGNLVEVDVLNAATGTPAGTTTFTFATAPTTGTNYQYVIIG